jgi:hypothetical protein
VVRALRGFGRFWWEFLVGDTPELTVAVAVVVGVSAALADVGRAAVVVAPLAVVGALGLSTWRRARAPTGVESLGGVSAQPSRTTLTSDVGEPPSVSPPTT